MASQVKRGESGGPIWIAGKSGIKQVLGVNITTDRAVSAAIIPTPGELRLPVTWYQDPPSNEARITSAVIIQSGDAESGQTVQFVLNMNENITVTGAGPTLTLNNGGMATYNAVESTGTELEFDYLVSNGQQTNSLEVTGATGTNTVQGPGGASIDFSVLDDQPTNLSINSPLTVTSVAASQTGEVGAGATVQLTLTMSEAVSLDTAGGAPTLYLDDGATALYDAAASNPTDGKLVFDYTVGADDATPNLEISSVLLPTGTTITDAAGYNADFSAADDAPTGLQVGAAFLTAITPSQTGDVTTGQTLALTLTMSQGVTVSGGAPTLSLSDGADATYDAAASNPSAGTLVFDYTVGAGDYATDLQILGYAANNATLTDAHGVAAKLAGAADDDLALDDNAAVVTGVAASPSTGEAGGGQEVKLTLTMNEAVVVNTAGGSPTLTLDDAATATYDAAASDPSAGALVFDYTVAAGDQTPNLQVSAVNLNGATIDDAHGHAADLSAADDFATGLQIGAAFVGGVTPSLTGDIFTGQTDQIVLTMSQAVTVDTANGSPTLSLSDGATATYDAAASNPADDTLAFDTTVGANDYATGLKIAGYNANGATVTDANGVAANFAGVNQDDLYIDVNATTVTGVAASAPSGEAGSGAEVAVTLTMSGAVVVDTANGSPTLSVGDGWTATYDSAASDPANGTLVFDYMVAVGDETPDLSVIQAYLNGATIDDANGHAVDLSAVGDFETGLQIGPVYVDQVTPSVSGDVATGQTVQFDVALSAPVTVDTAGGAPTLSLSDGEVATYDAAASSPAADELVFDYTVAAGDYAKNLAITGFDANGATVEDANGVGVDFSGLTSSDLGLDVNATTVVGLAASPSTGAALPGQQVVLTLTLSGPVAVDTTAGSPTLYLSDGAVAAYDAAASDPSSGTLAFDFTDAPGDATPDLAITQVNAQGAVITDAHGNAPDFSAALGVDTGLEVSAACYVRGARIATPGGYVPIEDLREGDLALTASGAARPIRRIGHRRLDLSRHPRPAEVRPVRVARGAFDDGLPLRDLWLSPGHNIAWDGALIPISALLNGVSVAQVARDRVEYWHVELNAHDVILAEGLPAESYLDTGNRTAFANGGAFVEAHPDFQPRHWAETCLPLVTQGPAVVAVRARLLARLFEQGYSLDRQAEAHVVIDGRRIEPIRLSQKRLSFLLPAGGREITLRSKTFVPAQADACNADWRELGLAVGRLWIDGEAVSLDRDEACGSGWRPAECESGRFQRRWTHGAVRLRAGARSVLVELADFGQYWREPKNSDEAMSA
jgi:hypothetical protein